MRKEIKEILVCSVFMLFLYSLWVLDLVSPDRIYSDWEKRMLAKRPVPVRSEVFDGSYGRAYEEWLTDQFPAREGWVYLKTRCELLLGKKEINGIYIGKDGFLFARQEAAADWDRLEVRMIGQYGEAKVSRIHVPAAGAVLTEQLPEGISFTSGKDAVWENLRAHREEYIYYRTDHHWTMLGAYYAYEAWAGDRGMVPVPLEEMEHRTVKEGFRGTHYARLHYAGKADVIEVYDPGTDCSAVYDLGASELTGLYQPKLLDSEDAYRYFLDGNHPVVQIQTGQGEGHLAVLKDSFANCLIPYLTCHYQEITVIDPRYFRADIAAWLEEQEITEVLIIAHDGDDEAQGPIEAFRYE